MPNGLRSIAKMPIRNRAAGGERFGRDDMEAMGRVASEKIWAVLRQLGGLWAESGESPPRVVGHEATRVFGDVCPVQNPVWTT